MGPDSKDDSLRVYLAGLDLGPFFVSTVQSFATPPSWWGSKYDPHLGPGLADRSSVNEQGLRQGPGGRAAQGGESFHQSEEVSPPRCHSALTQASPLEWEEMRL